MAHCPYSFNVFPGNQCPETSSGSGGCYLWGTGCPNKAGGDTYSKTMTMEDDNATRFESSAKTLRDIVIIVETHPMLLGKTGVEVYPVGAGETVGLTKVDISTLYFKNAGAGNNGKITILGTEE